MGRETCSMWEQIGKEIYCGYYDIGCMLCEENRHCPEESDDDYDEFIDEDEITDTDVDYYETRM